MDLERERAIIVDVLKCNACNFSLLNSASLDLPVSNSAKCKLKVNDVDYNATMKNALKRIRMQASLTNSSSTCQSFLSHDTVICASERPAGQLT